MNLCVKVPALRENVKENESENSESNKRINSSLETHNITGNVTYVGNGLETVDKKPFDYLAIVFWLIFFILDILVTYYINKMLKRIPLMVENV